MGLKNKLGKKVKVETQAPESPTYPVEIKTSFPELQLPENPESIKTGNYQLIPAGDNKNLNLLLDELEKCSAFAFDFETTGKNPLKEDIVGISFSTKAGTGYYLPIMHNKYDYNWDIKILDKFAPYWQNSKKMKIAHHLQYEQKCLMKHGHTLVPPLFDPMLAARLLNCFKSLSLKNLVKEIFNHSMITYEEMTSEVIEVVDKKGKKKQKIIEKPFSDVPMDEKCLIYTCGDSDWALQITNYFIPLLEKENLYELCVELDSPLAKVIADMEYLGWYCDKNYLINLENEANARKEELEIEIEREIKKQLRINPDSPVIIPVGKVHKPLNINSTAHIGWILFDQLKFPVLSRTEATGRPAVDKEVINRLAKKYPNFKFFKLYKEYSKYKKILSTYITGMLPHITSEGRIHTEIDQVHVRTSRFSSSNPNLHNIPRAENDPLGIRGAFVASPGKILLLIDYSQIELRVFAYYSQDPTMTRAFIDSQDIHTETYKAMHEIPENVSITPEQRQEGKTINFGIIFGMQAKSLANNLGINELDAKKKLELYYRKHPGIQKYMNEQILFARNNGFITTFFGRKRSIPDISSSNFFKRLHAERQAINTPIQGSASEIIKLAMVNISNELPGAPLVMQIHDELIFEVDINDTIFFAENISKIMEREIPGFNIPIVTETSIAYRWSDKKELIKTNKGYEVKIKKSDTLDDEFYKLLNNGGISYENP